MGLPQSPGKYGFAYGSCSHAVCALEMPSKNCFVPGTRTILPRNSACRLSTRSNVPTFCGYRCTRMGTCPASRSSR